MPRAPNRGVAIGLKKRAGFAEIVVLAGGINAWQQANMPVEK
jgi:rhodanese-related sulfurtransferase